MAFQSLSQSHGLSRGVKGHSSTLPRGALGAICACANSGGVSLFPPQPLSFGWVVVVNVLNALCGLSEASLVA